METPTRVQATAGACPAPPQGYCVSLETAATGFTLGPSEPLSDSKRRTKWVFFLNVLFNV